MIFMIFMIIIPNAEAKSNAIPRQLQHTKNPDESARGRRLPQKPKVYFIIKKPVTADISPNLAVRSPVAENSSAFSILEMGTTPGPLEYHSLQNGVKKFFADLLYHCKTSPQILTFSLTVRI